MILHIVRRGRYSYTMYKQMKYEELISTSPQHYVTLAVRLLSDDDYRTQQSIIIQNKFKFELHKNHLVAVEWVQFLIRAYNQLMN